jgi:hypothetical protein
MKLQNAITCLQQDQAECVIDGRDVLPKLAGVLPKAAMQVEAHHHSFSTNALQAMGAKVRTLIGNELQQEIRGIAAQEREMEVSDDLVESACNALMLRTAALFDIVEFDSEDDFISKDFKLNFGSIDVGSTDILNREGHTYSRQLKIEGPHTPCGCC